MEINRVIIQQILLILYFLLNYNEVQGEIKLSKAEDQELERQLKLLNKPAIKTIKTKYGDTYDCVNFYEQPAFDHPSLKNHNFHPKMKPTLPRIKRTSSTSTSTKSSMIWKNGRGCPFGSVPIKRVTKDDLIRHRLMPPPEDVTFHTQFSKTNNSNSELKRKFLSSAQGYKVAIVSTLNDGDNKFGGAGMAAILWKPYVEDGQHSGCRLKVRKRSDIIQIGWRVDPTLYGDGKTRMFIHFQAGKRHCFNTLCPGFVLVNTEVPIEAPFAKTSQRGNASNLYEYKMYIDRDLVNGNWWALVEDYQELGFWPKDIFTDLAGFATKVEWGGVAYALPEVLTEPPMGSSFFPIKRFEYDGTCRNITVLDYTGETVDVKTISHTDNPFLYQVFNISYGPGEHTVFYGGPGGRT